MIYNVCGWMLNPTLLLVVTLVVLYVDRFTGWFLHKLLGRLLSAVIVHRGQMQMLQLACKVSCL